MSIHRTLNKDEEKEFRQWARDNFTAGKNDVNLLWHPIVQDECHIMIDENLKEQGLL